GAGYPGVDRGAVGYGRGVSLLQAGGGELRGVLLPRGAEPAGAVRTTDGGPVAGHVAADLSGGARGGQFCRAARSLHRDGVRVVRGGDGGGGTQGAAQARALAC